MAGKLTKGIFYLSLTQNILGEKTIMNNGFEWNYTGEINEDGMACGFGEIVNLKGWDTCRFKGIFVNDRGHGFGKKFRIEL